MGREKTQQIHPSSALFLAGCSQLCWRGALGGFLTHLSAFCAGSHSGSVVRTKFSFACKQQTSTSSAKHWTNPVLSCCGFFSLPKDNYTSNPLIGLFKTHIFWSFSHYFTEDSLNIRGEKVPLEQEQSLECVCLGFSCVLGKHTSGISALLNGTGWCLLRKQ